MSVQNEKEVKVSVVVVCYNQEATIGRAIDSVLSQKVDFNYEIIIGDDASSDKTSAICLEYCRKYPDFIRYIRNETNKGLLNNYYDCVLQARGKYISDLGGDDFWIEDNKLQIQSDTMDKYPDVSLVHTDWLEFHEEKGTYLSPWATTNDQYPYLDKFASEYPPEFLLCHLKPVVVHLCSAMYRKDFFLELFREYPDLFRNKDYLMEDLQLIVLLATKGRFLYINKKTLAYSINDKSITGNTDFIKQFDFYFSSLKMTSVLEKIIEADQDKLLPFYKETIHFLAMQSFHADDRKRMKALKSEIKKMNVAPTFQTKVILWLGCFNPAFILGRKVWKIYRKLVPRK